MDGKRKQQAVDALAAIYLEELREELAERNEAAGQNDPEPPLTLGYLVEEYLGGGAPYEAELAAAVRKQAECEPS